MAATSDETVPGPLRIPENCRKAVVYQQFAWLYREFDDVSMVYSGGKYLEHCEIRWETRCLRSSRAQELMLRLTQADGWQIDHVRWQWFDADIGMRSVTLVRHARDRD